MKDITCFQALLH